MDRETLMHELEAKAFAARIGLHALCREAKLSGTIATRWRQGRGVPSLPTIGKLESRLAEIEASRIAA